MANEPRTVTVQILCTDLPDANWGGHAGICVGIQKGKDVEQVVQLPASSVTFQAELRVGNDESEPAPNFLGPFAQGPKGDRFLYICWGTMAFGRLMGFRRAKLPLSELTWASIASGQVSATLRCTDAKGGPVCATVKHDRLQWSC